MTNTTDIAVLYAIAARAKETGTSFVIPAETALSMLKHIGALRDNLEAERQRSDEMTEQYLDRNSALTSATLRYEKAEAELAELRGEQEPVAWRNETNKAITIYKSVVDNWERNGWNVTPLFTRQPKPVVDDSMALAFHQALNDGGIGHSDLEEIKIGLRAALGVYDSIVVKDGD